MVAKLSDFGRKNIATVFLLLFVVTAAVVNGDDDAKNQESIKTNELITKNQKKMFTSLFKDYSSRVRPCGPKKEEVSEKAAGSGDDATTTKPKESDKSPEKTDDDDSAEKTSCGPTNVNVSVYLKSVDDIDDKDMKFSLQLIFRQSWSDHRLAYKSMLSDEYKPKSLSLPRGDQQFEIWKPDTFFVNGKDARQKEADKDTVMIKIDERGDVTYSSRETLTLGCLMDFRRYPRDEQKCSMILSSYGHNEDQVAYKWRTTGAVLTSPDLKASVGNFEYVRVKRESCSIDSATAGTFSCLKLNFYFKRVFNFSQFSYLFLPGFLLVVVSWLTFWFGTQATPTRITYGLLCLITLVLQLVIVAPSFPPASSHRCIDSWFIICLLFLVAVLIQTIVVYRMTKWEIKHGLTTDQAALGTWAPNSIAAVLSAQPQLIQQALRDEDMNVLSPSNKSSQGKAPPSTGRLSQKRSMANITLPKKSMAVFVKTPERRISIQQDVTQVTPLIDNMVGLKDKENPDYLPARKKANCVVRKWSRLSQSEKLDVICRILFPVIFFLFNIIFWFS